MTILDNVLIISLHVACFIAGIKLANYYNNKAASEMKDALERQFLRIKANIDADDPCRPYTHRHRPITDPVPQEFMDRLHENGSASMKIAKTQS